MKYLLILRWFEEAMEKRRHILVESMAQLETEIDKRGDMVGLTFKLYELKASNLPRPLYNKLKRKATSI